VCITPHFAGISKVFSGHQPHGDSPVIMTAKAGDHPIQVTDRKTHAEVTCTSPLAIIYNMTCIVVDYSCLRVTIHTPRTYTGQRTTLRAVATASAE
jgi:hypothetical protein